MKSVSICHAPRDREKARELARFIELNFGFEISLDDALVTPEQDVLAATEKALSAQYAIAILSPASVPAPLKRDEWERVFVKAPLEYGTPLAFVMIEDCAFPELLKRGRVIDATQNFLETKRIVKRWILSCERGPRTDPKPLRSPVPADLDAVWRDVVDAPGFAARLDSQTADSVCAHCGEDFERVIRIRSSGRPLEVILGELGRAIALKLPGPVDENKRQLEWHCAPHRYLFVFDGAAEKLSERLRMTGRTSVVIAEALPPVIQPVERVTAANIGDAIDYALLLMESNAEAGGALAMRVVRQLSDMICYAEAALVCERLIALVPGRAEWAQRELVWIRSSWDDSVKIPDSRPITGTQGGLFGDDGWLAA